MPVFITILFISILAGAEVDLFIPSFPELQRVFHLSPFLVQLTLSVNFVAYCLCSLFAGMLGDRFNRRQVILYSLVAFVIGSIACVLAINYPMLVIGRFLQGLGIAGPCVLSYAVISDLYSPQKQAELMGILNGLTASAMAFAPLIGSYITLYFGWRANFLLLFFLSASCLIASYFYIPNRQGDPHISLSPRAYWPLLCSTKLMTFLIGFCFLASTYWIFIGMAPILYMHALNIPLREFGLYQGVLAGAFAVGSLSSARILRRFGQKRCLVAGMGLTFLCLPLLVWLVVFNIQHAWAITVIMVLFSIAAVFPINILYPISLTVIENTKGRTTALFMALRLILTAIGLQVTSYFYSGTFIPLGIAMIILLVVALLFFCRLLVKGWATLES